MGRKLISMTQIVGCSQFLSIPGARTLNRRFTIHLHCRASTKALKTEKILPSLIQESHLSVSGERMCTILVNRLED